MIIRVQTWGGMKRINIEYETSLSELFRMVSSLIHSKTDSFNMFLDSRCQDRIYNSSSSISSIGLCNGDIIYAVKKPGYQDQKINSTVNGSFSSKVVVPNSHIEKAITDIDTIDQIDSPIDELLYKKICKVRLPQNIKCNHSSNSQCINCTLIDAHDDRYLESIEPPLKHIPFHCYLRKNIDSVQNRLLALLEQPDYKIKMDCPEHPPYPKASCSRCLPSSITLEHQGFRFVDNIMFQSHVMVDNFINFWRKSGAQRIGYLYGYYDELDSLPLATRANVVFIYEPPQTCSNDTVSLIEDKESYKIDSLAESLGLQKIGWILTHLVRARRKELTVEYIRRSDTFLVSGQECITASYLQNLYPNLCKFSSSKKFGSKFITVIVTGNEQNNIDFYGYQFSNQAMALVDAKCIRPTIDNPGLICVEKSTDNKFVPDILYKENIDAKNTVLKNASVFPVDYFLVQIPVGFPLSMVSESNILPNYNLNFINRMHICEKINNSDISAIVNNSDPTIIWNSIRCFGVLYILFTSPVTLFNDIGNYLCSFIRNKDFQSFKAFMHTEEWLQFCSILSIDNSDNLPDKDFSEYIDLTGDQIDDDIIDITNNDLDVNNSYWTCSFCTFNNMAIIRDTENNIICEICGLPKN